jgi:hypothetical protein
MKTKAYDQGTVFNYSYLWSHEQDQGLEFPKDRPVCVIFRLTRPNGESTLALVPISDLMRGPPDLCIAIPEAEKSRARLSESRAAYVHIGEYNVEERNDFWPIERKSDWRGRFSRPFTTLIAKRLAAAIRDKRATRINRT